MKDKDLYNKPLSELREEDYREIRRTIKRIPANSTRQHNSADDINRKHIKPASRKDNRIRYVLICLGVLAIVAVIVVIVINNKSKKADTITGRWSLDDVTVYSFDGNGHGEMALPLNTYEFSYLIEADKIKIDFINESAEDREYSYIISEDTLTLTDADGTEYIFTNNESLKGQTE